MKPMNPSHQYPLQAFIHAVGVVLCCASFEAAAADWTSISKDKQSEILVDMDSYNESDGLPYIVSKTQFFKPQIYRKNALEFSYTESLSTTQFNCALHTFKNNSTLFYNASKKRVGSEKNDFSFKPIMAGSKYIPLESLVCQVHKMVGGN